MNRTFVPLVTDYDGRSLKNWLASTKVDGLRCLWDGGITRGVHRSQINFVPTKDDVATGLWTRYGNVFHAPDWFLDSLPKGVMLDGELFVDSLSETKSVCSRKVPDARWTRVTYHVFDLVNPTSFFTTGLINNPHMEYHRIDITKSWHWIEQLHYRRAMPFRDRLAVLGDLDVSVLPYTLIDNNEHALELFEKALADKEEGIVFRDPNERYVCRRSKAIMRMKIEEMSLAKVLSVSHDPRSIEVEWKGVQFRIGSGLKTLPSAGDTVMFRHAGLTDKSIPREAAVVRHY